MALQMATNITPDVFSGVGGAVFDAGEGLSVSWQVNGSPYLLAYQITICQIDDNSTQLYTTGKVTLSEPFYGVLSNGSIQMFRANAIDSSTLASAGISNGNEYKMYITQWWGNTDQDSVTNQSAAVIQAYSTPSVAINTYPNPINSRMYTFSGTFQQAEGDGIEWARWILYDQSNGDTVLNDTGKIYGTSQLQYTHDAFFTGTIYGIELIVMSQSGQQVSSGMQTVYISYASGAATGSLTAMQKCGWNGVNVSWESAKNMYGTSYGDFSFNDEHQLVLPNNGSVSWETEGGTPIAFAPEYSIVWVGSLPSGAQFTPFSASVSDGEISISVVSSENQTTANVLSDGTSFGSVSVNVSAIGNDATLYVMLTPTQLHMTVLLPDGSTISDSATLDEWLQETITSVRLQGPQNCLSLWVEHAALEGPIVPSDFQPSFVKTTYFLTAFQNQDLNAGNSDTTGYSLYRLDNTTGEYLRIADLGVGQTGIIDYSAKNGHSYTYQLWYASDTIFTRLPFLSNEITPCRWNVLLIAAQKDEAGVYHPQSVYAFGCNVSFGDENNNSKTTTQDTFNGYPAIQRSSNQYRSGQLTALIGKIDPFTNQYINDHSDYSDELMALSTSNMTLFLRDRRGAFRMVTIKGAIKQKIDAKLPTQSASITIPWVEVAPAEQISVILTNQDSLWPYDEIADTTVYVDIQDGHLYWKTPNDYQPNIRGSVLNVNASGHLTQRYDGTDVEMADAHIDFTRMHLIVDQ